MNAMQALALGLKQVPMHECKSWERERERELGVVNCDARVSDSVECTDVLLLTYLCEVGRLNKNPIAYSGRTHLRCINNETQRELRKRLVGVSIGETETTSEALLQSQQFNRTEFQDDAFLEIPPDRGNRKFLDSWRRTNDYVLDAYFDWDSDEMRKYSTNGC